MGLPVTVYRWDDAGAPQLSNQKPSEIINVLKKCLVEGYGSKAALGWSVVEQQANINAIVFTNASESASGGVLKVWSKTGADTSSAGLSITSAASATGLNSLFDSGYTFDFKIYNRPANWYLIGTSDAFYFHVISQQSLSMQPVTSDEEPMFFAGDLISFIPSDARRFTCIGGNGNNSQASLSLMIEGWSLAKIYDTDGGATGGTQTYFNPSIHRVDGKVRNTETPLIANVPHKFSPIVLYGGVSETDRNGKSTRISNLSPWCRGKMPGFYFSTFNGYADHQWPVIENFGGEDFILVRSKNALHLWVNISQW